MNLLGSVAIAFAGLLVIALAGVDPGSEKVAFPTNFKSGVLYNVIDRDDQKEVHHQYTSLEAIEAAKAGKPLPAGTVITSANYKAVLDPQGNPIRDAKGNFVAGELDRVVVMEKRPGTGAAYPENLRNGDWEFAAFTADGKFNPQAPAKEVCMACHKPHERLDYVKNLLRDGREENRDQPGTRSFRRGGRNRRALCRESLPYHRAGGNTSDMDQYRRPTAPIFRRTRGHEDGVPVERANGNRCPEGTGSLSVWRHFLSSCRISQRCY